jgi:serine/threonine protein kinase
MTEVSTSNANETAGQIESNLHARLDALQNGECGEEYFLQEILALRESAPNLVWTTLALIDQRYRRGHLTSEIFRSINSKLARHALEAQEYGATVELHPTTGSVRPRTAVAAPTPAIAQATSFERIQHASELAEPRPARPNPPSIEPDEIHPPANLQERNRVLNGRYTLECVLGRGGMGTVFRALDQHRADLPLGNRHVALKVLDEGLRGGPEIVANLRREFYCAQALAHPNIVKVYEIYHDEDVAFYTMELLEGQLLSDHPLPAQPLPIERSFAWAIIRSVGAALAHAHLRNVVHGDLKPQNIMITKNREVRILDFGASGTSTSQWITSDPLQRNRFPPVTLAYACCELLDGQQTDPRDDLYALACLSYELLAGKHPFERRRSTEAREQGMKPKRPTHLTDRQWRALQLGLSWRREDRSLSVHDWLTMLGLEPAAERLPSPQATGTVRAHFLTRRSALPALLTLSIVLISLWVFSHIRPEHKAAGSIGRETSAGLPQSTAPNLSTPGVASEVAMMPKSAPMESLLPLFSPPTEPATALSFGQEAPEIGSPGNTAPTPRRPVTNEIGFSADTYRVRSDEHFAEINIHRSNESQVTSSFEWWTEGASARPGSDFIAQTRTTQIFPKGRLWTKLFVRIVPNSARAHVQTFYVNIAGASAGAKLSSIMRAAILIPPPAAVRDAPPIQSAQREP